MNHPRCCLASSSVFGMRWSRVVLSVSVLCLVGPAWCGKWRGGGRSKPKKTPSQPNYPKQPPSWGHDSRPPAYNPGWNPQAPHAPAPAPGWNPQAPHAPAPAPGWNIQTPHAPAPAPGWNQQPSPPGWKQPSNPPSYNPGPPPPYSKNPPHYPQSGGHDNPPPYSHYPQSGHYPQGGYYPQGSYPSYSGYPGYSQGSFSHFPQYPQSYGGGYNDYKQKKGWSMPGIIPLPIPIPIGGGGFGLGSFGGGFYRPKGNSVDSKEDEKERPRILVPPDLELDGVTELPAGSPIAQWDIVGKEKAMNELKKRDEDYSGEFTDN